MTNLSKFHHVNFSVSNAVQAAFWYCTCFGFRRHAIYRDKTRVRICVKNAEVFFVFTSQLSHTEAEKTALITHGDSVNDVAFVVDNLGNLVELLQNAGSELLEDVTIIKDQEGSIKIARVQSKESDLVHTLIENVDYDGCFLPNFVLEDENARSPLLESLPPLKLEIIDHVVQNYPKEMVEPVAEWYDKALQLQRFWSIDDTVCTSEFSAMKAWLVTNPDHKVQMTIAEPVEGTRRGRSQIQEFVDYNGGAGIQHIALRVTDIIGVVTEMKNRSIEFLSVPSSYYDDLDERLSRSKINVIEDVRKLRELSILVDFDENGYLLQIFTKPVQDRPTLFMEIIQRYNFNGFGAGNFKALFDAIEREQARRGTLVDE